jgi:hypothetical protein
MAKKEHPAEAGPGLDEQTYVEVLVENLGRYHKGDVTDDPVIVALLDDGTDRVRLAPKPFKRPPTDGLTEGRIVRYVLDDGPHAGESRAAVVVKVWDRETGCVNLQVFLDGENDGDSKAWVTSVFYSEEHDPRTWHWISKE